MSDRDRRFDSTDGKVERAKDAALGKHDSNPSHVDEVAEGVGGVGGVLTGAALGSGAGPIGTIVGGIAGAVGGWWAGRAVTEAASTLTREDDEYYRGHYEQSPNRLADRSYDDVRPAYMLGHLAAHNPDYRNRSWKEVSKDLQRGWSVDNAKRFGDWESISGYAGEGYERGRSIVDTGAKRTAESMQSIVDRNLP
ncbi:MAG TPA: hypothetical protein VF929_10520 [Gemmatimonadaceae bacterium]